VNDRSIVAARMKAHVSKADTIPLLIFPEGTCVNNEYSVMFKRGAFDLGATVGACTTTCTSIGACTCTCIGSFTCAALHTCSSPFPVHMFSTSWSSRHACRSAFVPQVCPVAIKYNKIFVDAFWNSRREAFGHHLFRLFTSWALVCDVYFLEPQNIRPGEATLCACVCVWV
jgi:glycerol-3-phosphate O-acyltransferase 3/4